MLSSISAHWQRLSSNDAEAPGKPRDGGRKER
jgi:hypothetical protein